MAATGALHHIDLTVSDLERGTACHDLVLPLVGLRRQYVYTPDWNAT